MSTPSNRDTDAPAAITTSTGYTVIPAPIATNDQRVCFICLQTDTDTPNRTWVNACPCSLEAHEQCLLRWIAEMEASRTRTKSGFQCPACKAPFIIEEHHDPFVTFRDRLYGRYSRASPYILLVLVAGGSVAGAACYGLSAAAVFAGPETAMRWVGFRTARTSSIMGNMWLLSWVGPGLVFLRLLPSFGSGLLIPVSIFVGYPSRFALPHLMASFPLTS